MKTQAQHKRRMLKRHQQKGYLELNIVCVLNALLLMVKTLAGKDQIVF